MTSTSIMLVILSVCAASESAESSAMLELTGDAPKILFGEIEAPACELQLNRETGRLTTTCDISLGDTSIATLLAENAELAAQHLRFVRKIAALEAWKEEAQAQLESLRNSIVPQTPQFVETGVGFCRHTCGEACCTRHNYTW